MSLKNSAAQYGSVSKFFHWLIFILVFLMIAIVFLAVSGLFSKPIVGELFDIHKVTGLVILILVILRLLWALSNQWPQINRPSWEIYLARFVHAILYLLLLAMPIVGWIGVTAAGFPPEIFGYKLFFPGITENKALADSLLDAHVVMAWILIILLGLHIVASFKHHFIHKDDILKRMLP